MTPARKLLERVARREIVVGLLATDHLWTDLVEISARSGMDYLIVDMEHGAHSPELVAEVCSTGRRMDFPVFIRPRSNDYATLRLAIDLGCCGFLLASVETAAEMDTVAEAVRLPPRGKRRPGGHGNRWVVNFGAQAWRETVEDAFIVMPQIETRRGLANLAEIAAHEMTTVVAVGPYDLSAELGVCGEMQSPVLRESLGVIRAAAETTGKPMWMIGPDGAALVADGYKFLCIGEPTWVLVGALKQAAASARGAVAAKPKGYTS